VSNADPIPAQNTPTALADLELVAAIRTRAESLEHHARRALLCELQEYCTAEILKIDAESIERRMTERRIASQPPQ
jgi:hypothetical protein